MKLQTTVAALLCLSSASVLADEVDLSLSNDTALLRYISPISYSGYGRTDAAFGVMYTEANDYLLSAGIEMVGEAGSQAPGLNGGINIELYGASLDYGYDIGALAIGGKVWYVPPSMSRLGFVAQLNYAPNVTTFGDASRFSDFSTRVEYEVFPDAAVYVGYRKVTARIENTTINVNLDKGWHGGIRISF